MDLEDEKPSFIAEADLMEQARERVDDEEEFMRLDLESHNRIARGARNGILELFMASIDCLSLYDFRRTSEFLEVRRQTVRDHRAIVAALKARDPQKARAAMLRHIARVEKSLGGLERWGCMAPTGPMKASKERTRRS